MHNDQHYRQVTVVVPAWSEEIDATLPVNRVKLAI